MLCTSIENQCSFPEYLFVYNLNFLLLATVTSFPMNFSNAFSLLFSNSTFVQGLFLQKQYMFFQLFFFNYNNCLHYLY